MQIQTGCEGLNLQENYSEIYFVSPHWNPAIEDQAIARCHRIGQLKQVYVFRFKMEGFGLEKIEEEEDLGDLEDLEAEDLKDLKDLEDVKWRPTIALDEYVALVQNLKRDIQAEFMPKVPLVEASASYVPFASPVASLNASNDASPVADAYAIAVAIF